MKEQKKERKKERKKGRKEERKKERKYTIKTMWNWTWSCYLQYAAVTFFNHAQVSLSHRDKSLKGITDKCQTAISLSSPFTDHTVKLR